MKSESLYGAAVATLARNLDLYSQADISAATTDRMKFDLVRELYSQRRTALLVQVLVNWDDGFCPVLCLGERRTELHAIFQRVIDTGLPADEDLPAQPPGWRPPSAPLESRSLMLLVASDIELKL